jgi:ABC-2 type transport system ATP-binding protein
VSVLETLRLGKRYRRTWALRECGLSVPEGRVAALAGPNGAGKTTLLRLAAGLAEPTTGQVRVLDGVRPGSAAALAGIGFVGQDAPLYRNLPVAAMLSVAARLSQSWDAARAADRIAALGLPPGRRVGALSGGQQAQLALTLALAKRPRLLILDEPLARLDPLARHDFMAMLMAAVAEDGLSVIFSSHVVPELERVADYLIVLSRGRVQLAGETDGLLAGHAVLTGPAGVLPERLDPVAVTAAGAQAHLLVRVPHPGWAPPPGFRAGAPGLEELVLAYLREPAASALPGPAGPGSAAVAAAEVSR